MFGQLVATSGKAIFVYHIMEVFKGFNMIVVIYQKSALLKQQYYSLNSLLSITYFQSSVIFKLKKIGDSENKRCSQAKCADNLA